MTPTAGAVGGLYSGTGPNGGSYRGGAGAAWKQGVGGVEQTGFSGTAANGNQYAGYTKGAYNAQTGQGTYNSGKSYTNGQTGQQYGYNQSTQFTKGEGGQTTIDTKNNGDYQVDYQKGQKPTVVETAPPANQSSMAAAPATSSASYPTNYAAPPVTMPISYPTTYAAPPVTVPISYPTTYAVPPAVIPVPVVYLGQQQVYTYASPTSSSAAQPNNSSAATQTVQPVPVSQMPVVAPRLTRFLQNRGYSY